MEPKIIVYTRAYNTKPYLRQCIESVLNQTYSNFIYIIVDNGCTDGSSEIIEEYAGKDDRIRRIRFEKNSRVSTGEQIKKFCDNECEYITILDSDDWWESDYLASMVKLAQDHNADIVSTGSYMHIDGTDEIFERKLQHCLVMGNEQYAEWLPYYHVFFRTVWAKLIRRDMYLNSKILTRDELISLGIQYGSDTLNSFVYLRNSKKVVVDNSILHHYRVHQKSVSHKYDKRQSFSDLYLYNDMLDFLKPYGPISDQNQDFLYRVYSNAVLDTNANIKKSDLTPAEKMNEYRNILERDVTKKAFALSSEESNQCRADLIGSVLNCAAELPDDNEDLNAIKTKYFPKCAAAVYANSAKLFLADSTLFDYIINDYRKPMVKYVLSLIDKQKFVKQYDLGEILRRLSQDKPILADISDMKFLKKYGHIYLLVWSEKYSDSLDVMTDILLKETVSNETFLHLYQSLAASLECVDEFIFGKIKLAAYYCLQKRADDCRAILTDLTDMGVEDNDELLYIKQQLKLI